MANYRSLAPVVDDGAVEYVEYTFPYFDVDPGQELWNNKPTYEQDVRWLESYSEGKQTYVQFRCEGP